MKKLLFILFITTVLSAHAYDFKVGDLVYNINADDNAKVSVTYTSRTTYSDPTLNNYYGVTDVNIPETVPSHSSTPA